MPNQEVNKFVILAMPRTGSTLLTTTLNTHPDIACHGEIFRRNIKKIQGPVKILNKVDSEFQDEDYRIDNPFALLDNICRLEEKSTCIGFKLMLVQHPSLMENIIKDKTDFKIIFLKRDNVLSVYSSDRIAQATGQNIAGKKSNIKTAKVKFEATSFEEFLDKYESKYQHTKQLLESVNREHLELEYNDLRSPQGFEEVLRFLKVNEEVMRTPTKKRNSDSILERFTNPKVVRDYLKSKDLQKWITEKQ